MAHQTSSTVDGFITNGEGLTSLGHGFDGFHWTSTGAFVSTGSESNYSFNFSQKNDSTVTASTVAGVFTVNGFGGRFKGKMKAWDTDAPYANGVNVKMFASDTYGAAAVNSTAHLLSTDADGVYNEVITDCNPGNLYWVQKESSDGSIASLQLQLATSVGTTQ